LLGEARTHAEGLAPHLRPLALCEVAGLAVALGDAQGAAGLWLAAAARARECQNPRILALTAVEALRGMARSGAAAGVYETVAPALVGDPAESAAANVP
jgi:hypothetical protein